MQNWHIISKSQINVLLRSFTSSLGWPAQSEHPISHQLDHRFYAFLLTARFRTVKFETPAWKGKETSKNNTAQAVLLSINASWGFRLPLDAFMNTDNWHFCSRMRIKLHSLNNALLLKETNHSMRKENTMKARLNDNKSVEKTENLILYRTKKLHTILHYFRSKKTTNYQERHALGKIIGILICQMKFGKNTHN